MVLFYFLWKDLLLLKSHPLPHTVGLRRLFDFFVNVQFDGVLVSEVFFLKVVPKVSNSLINCLKVTNFQHFCVSPQPTSLERGQSHLGRGGP